MTQKILLVEDGKPLADQVISQLTTAGFDLQWWPDVAPMAAAGEVSWALVILDLMLPGGSGLDMLRALRMRTDAPVLIFSARYDSVDKVEALELGADDDMNQTLLA